LASRLTIWYAASAFALVLIATSLLYVALERNLDREDDGYLADKVRILGVLLRDPERHAKEIEQEVQLEWSVSRDVPMYVRILDGARRTVTETPGMRERLPADAFPGSGDVDAQEISGSDIHSRGGPVFRVVVARIGNSASAEGGREIQVALDRSRDQILESAYRRQLAITLGIALIACTVIGYLLARRGMEPLRQIAGAIGRIGSANIHERVAMEGLPTELAGLAGRFNEMLTRLEGSFTRLSQFPADVAHELRTPINNLRGEAQVALSRTRSAEEYRDVLGSCLEESERLYRMIDSLLFLARTENPQTRIDRVPVEVREELERMRDFYESLASEKGVDLKVTAADGISATVDRGLFQRAIANLVENSFTHTNEGRTISLSAARKAGALWLEVGDTGCGIPAAHLPHVFDRLYRVDRARSRSNGAGLGLAIVKSIATLHGGNCSIASEFGRGTHVTLVLPNA
jgi:two-component system heavy metal sensor histidine kinase CusS